MLVKANVISRILGKVHTKSETYGSRIVGVNTWTRGYHVAADYTGTVYVSFRAYRNAKEHDTMLQAYANTLNNAGYRTEVTDRFVKVIGKE